MSKKEIYQDNRFMSLARVFIALIMLFIMGVLTAQSILGTTSLRVILDEDVVDTAIFRFRPSWESVAYLSDNIFGNILWLVCGFLFITLLLPLIKKIPLWWQILITITVTIILGYIWVFSSNLEPTEDSARVTLASLNAYNNNFNFLNGDDHYFQNYSYQLGYVLFNEVILHIANIFTPVKNLLFLEFINVILLGIAYGAIIYINHLLFGDKRICAVTALLLMLSAQSIIFCSFLYGIIPGLTFSVLAILFMLLYLKKDKLIYAPLSVLSIALSVMIKQNYLIVLVAVCCILFVTMFKRKRFIRDILFIITAVALCSALNPAIKSFYEKRADVDLGESVPITAWVAMGLNEAGNAPGWYSADHTVNLHSECEFNAEMTNEKSIEEIKKRINYFGNNYQYCNEFFYKKFMSQWNETSYESIWNNQVRKNYFPRIGVAEWVCGSGENAVKRYMDCYAQLIFLSVFVGLIACLKNKNFLSVAFPIIILGGMIYHILAEAKSQYAMPYFILMIGFAGYGIICAYDYFGKIAGSNKIAGFIFRIESDESSVAISAENKEISEAVDNSITADITIDEIEEKSK